MAKFHGVIGYATTTETAPGVHTEVITERACTGDILRNNQRWENGQQLNDNLVLGNNFSIIGDLYAYENIQSMRYVKWMGTCWEVTSVENRSPRLILTVGGVYNGG